MTSPYDPKLKTAAKEIEEILKKHDILGSMLLVSPTHVEYLFRFDATWSVMKFETGTHIPEGDLGLRFRSKREEFSTEKERHEATEATVHALTSFLQFGRMCQRNMTVILQALKSKMTIAYKVWD